MNDEPTPTEIEAKFHVPHLLPVRERVLRAGGRLAHPRTLERSLRFDTPDGGLRRQGVVLRLRRNARSTLTYKRAAGSFERRLEIELEVNDPGLARAFLEALGFGLVRTYEAYREVFHLGSARVMLDELPFGNFVEIEAPSLEAVRAVSGELGLGWERRLQLDTLSLFEGLRRLRGLAWEDGTFAQWRGTEPIRADELERLDRARSGR
jgi:adenylate cyclase class 2